MTDQTGQPDPPADGPNTAMVAALPAAMRALAAAGFEPQVVLAYWGEHTTVITSPTPTAAEATDALTRAGATGIRTGSTPASSGEKPTPTVIAALPGLPEVRVPDRATTD